MRNKSKGKNRGRVKLLAAVLAAALIGSDGNFVFAAEMESQLTENQAEEITSEENVPEETISEESIPEENIPEETLPEEMSPEEITPEENIQEENTAEEIKVITGFADFSITGHYLYCSCTGKPSEEELIAQMPAELTVYTRGNSVPQEAEVSWYCVTGDYGSSEYYYYQFSPVFNREEYQLDDSIDLLTEAPYVGVFLREGNSGITTEEGAHSSSSTVSYNAVTASENEALVYDYLVNTCQLSAAVACGLMANMEEESLFLPNNLQNSYEKSLGYTDQTYTAAVDNGTYTNFVNDSAGYGLMQWTYYTIKQSLYDYCKSKGTSIGDLTMQLDFTVSDSTSKNIFQKYMTGLANTEDGAASAAYNWCYYYERPANKETWAETRSNRARVYWSEYGDTSVSGSNGGIGVAGQQESTDTAGSAYEPGIYKVTATSLTVRSGPGTEYSQLGYLAEGTEETVTETAVNASTGRTWGKFEYKGASGWISLTYCTRTADLPENTAGTESTETTGTQTTETTGTESPEKTAASDKTGKYEVTASSLNVRSGPGTDYSLLGYLLQGTNVTVTETAVNASTNTTWGKFSYNGKTGWISLKYCKQAAAAENKENTETGNTEDTKADSSESTEAKNSESTGTTESSTVTESASQTEETAVYQVTASSLNVRSGAGSGYSKLGSLAKGTRVTVLSVSSNNWGKISYNGKTGWISLAYCQKVGTTSGTTTGTKYKVTASSLNVRSGPATSYSKLGSLSKGTQVTVLSVTNGWGKITYNGKTGYINLSYCVKM